MVVLGLALLSVAIVRPGPVEEWLGGARPTPPPATWTGSPAVPVLAGAGRDAPAPTAAGVAAALDPLITDRRLGSRVLLSVVDVASGEVLYARDPDGSATPASVTKVVTAVTVLAARGPGYRLDTRAVAGANPGEVVLVGGGDPTLAAGPTGSYPGAARLDDLAAKVKQALGGTAPSKVIVDTSLFSGPPLGPNWDSDIVPGGYGSATVALMTDGARVDPKDVTERAKRHQRPDIAAGQAFAKALGLPTSAVSAGQAPAPPANGASPEPAASPVPGTELGRVESPPLITLVEIMLERSDNVLAEALARQVALAKGQPASYEGAAAAMDAVLAELGLPDEENGLVDGSGLSRANRLTPSLLTDLFTVAARADRPELRGIFSGMPVAGYSGTLARRYGTAEPTRPGAGVVRAKTGTLSGVNTLAGIVTTQEGRLLAFAVLADKTPGGRGPEAALDAIATALARCGCR